MGYTMSYVGCYALGTWYWSFAVTGNAQTTPIFEAKFGWSDEETIFFNTIISSAAIIGLIIGSFLGAPLLKIGRRKGAIITNIIGIVSALISMSGSIPFLVIGRLLLGIAAGPYKVIFGKMIIENMPG